jgi:hypothetical protein
MGRLIPAGTGLGAYKRLSIKVDEPVGQEAEGLAAGNGGPVTVAAAPAAAAGIED